MSKPPRRQRAVVSYSTKVSRGAEGPLVHEDGGDDLVAEVPVAPGEASTTVGFNLKYWASDQSQGMTVGVTADVKLSCAQNTEELQHANQVAADLAYSYLQKHAKRIRRDLVRFFESEG